MKKLIYILTSIILLQGCSKIEAPDNNYQAGLKINTKPQLRTVDDTALVFFRIGQSNQAGYISDVQLQLQYLTLDSNVVFYNGTSFLPMSKTNNEYPAEAGKFASEFSFAWKVRANVDRKVYIIKHAVGSTSMYYNWKVAGTLYGNAKTTLTNALALIPQPYKLYVMYDQGEQDRTSVTYANAYQNHYITQISDLYSNYTISGYMCTKTDYNMDSNLGKVIKVRDSQENAINSFSNSKIVFLETYPLKKQFSSTVSSHTSTTLTDTTKSWTTNQWVGYYINLTQYSPLVRALITANTSNTLTVSTWGASPPTDGNGYDLCIGALHYNATQIDSLGAYEFRKWLTIK